MDTRIACPFDKGCPFLILEEQRDDHRQRFHLPEHQNSIQYWSDHFQALGHDPQAKAQKFVDLERIAYSGQGVYVCLPIEGYSKRVHVMRKDELGEFTCSCQGFHANGSCSHIGALYLYFSMGQKYPLKANL